MKKTLGFLMLFALLLTSCQTQLKTARTAETSASLRSVAVADLEVADERITHTLYPDNDIRRGGLDNVKQAVENEALAEHGNADVLLDPQYVIKKKRTLFGSKITSITVSGRPAYYRNFRTLDDSVWTNPAFNGVAPQTNTYRNGSRARVGGFAAYQQDEMYRMKGFDWSLGLTLMGSVFIPSEDDCGYCNDSPSFFGGVLMSSFGYRFGPHFYLGAGVGFMSTFAEEVPIIPFYLDARVDFSKKKNTFFFDYKLGVVPFGIDGAPSEGLFTAVALGYSFGKFDVAFQSIVQDFGYFCGYQYHSDYSDGLLTSYGLTFNYNF